ncbi:DUF3199 family protein [Bacillus thuringiensis]|uniref:Head completion protein n=3 Tax=root TaxID=1 RepID=A0A4P8MV51_9CAUD|nr:DUF3199 family protein [Bacillus thuringiensis]YP_009845448.1 head-tail adaptor [Bacillus phage vB_BtS_B83]MEB9095223.1 DUF3199 family protein [Bacillus cereus]AQY42391.1 hypothetical protein B4918_31300 [Bacillus thuringiensis]MDR4148505.1 DUF3199 family protein [Bacillus thuringiensis]MEC3575108.1 DUF3199 family protein [Bacillus thuringiensis]MED2019901.1 DUF3199 family protein [Bacillus thuringiensis]
MPIITPERLLKYTCIDDIKGRDPNLLLMDIVEAQNEIFTLTLVNFEDKEKFPTVPEVVEIACLKLAQYYALVNSDEDAIEPMQSERMGNYSYDRKAEKTATNSSQVAVFVKPDVSKLLSKWIQEKKDKGTANLRLRSI